MSTNKLFLYLILCLHYLSSVLGYGKYGLDFLVLGDWGGIPVVPFKTLIEVSISKQMAKTSAETNSSFVVALGDNFYFDGVKDVNDKRFSETYAEVFNDLRLPWYVIAGNHDHHGNLSAQVAYTKYSKTWRYPDYWYSIKRQVPGTNSTLKIVMIDTILLCGNTGYDDELLQPTGPDDIKFAEAQWDWLESQLVHSKDDYLIVGGHFPVWSVAEHGPTHCLVDRLLPMLEKYNVNAYICGHDHNLQHLKEKNSTVQYFVIGSANFVKDSKEHINDVPDESLQFYFANYSHLGGFAHVNVNEKLMQFSLIDAFGEVLHKGTSYPRNFDI